MPKFIKLNGTRGYIEEASATAGGVANANKVPELDANGMLTLDMMPVGIGPDTADLEASEALAAGAWVNIWDDAGTTKVRLADAPTAKPADGFVIAAVASGATAVVYFEGKNTGVTGLTGGADYWLGTNGASVATPPTTATHIRQYVGKANSATSMATEISKPTVLA